VNIKEILATYAMLKRFEEGEDIEKIFNTIRPKYPIRKYVEVFENIFYQSRFLQPRQGTPSPDKALLGP